MTDDKDKKDYTTPSPQELQKQLDERMAKFLAKGGKIEKLRQGLTADEYHQREPGKTKVKRFGR